MRISSRILSLALLLALSLTACRRGDGEAARVEALLQGLDTRGRAAQLVLIAVSLSEDGSAAALPPPMLSEAGAPGGYWVESGDARGLARFAAGVRELPGLRPLIGADLDSGVGGVVAGATQFPPLWRLLTTEDRSELGEVGLEIAREGAALGLDLGLISSPPTAGGIDLAGAEPEEIFDRVSALLAGAVRGRLAVGVRIFWDADERTGVDWDWSRLATYELPLIRAARAAGAVALAPGTLVIPGLAGDSMPVIASRAALEGVLRRDNAWRDLIIADLRRDGAHEVGQAVGVVHALDAGTDLLIVDTEADAEAAIESIVGAVAAGHLSAAALDASVRRALTFRVRTAASEIPLASPDSLPAFGEGRGWEVARRSAERAVLDHTGYRLPDAVVDPVLLISPTGRGRTVAAALVALERARDVPINLSADSATVFRFLNDVIAEAGSILYLDFPTDRGPSLHSMIRALPDSVLARRQIVRIAFRDWAGPAMVEDPPDLLVWGAGPASQLAAVATLLSGPVYPPRYGEGGAAPLQETPAAAVGMNAAGLEAADRAIEEALSRGTFTAAALAVGRTGGVVRFRGYGNVSPEGPPVDPWTTIFDLASLTKVVGTASAAALLVESGELELDAPVRRYIREFAGDDKDDVTVRHLLAHTSGLPPGLGLYASAGSREQALEQVIGQPLRRSPGLEAEYSDLGMILLAELIERAAEVPLDALLTRRLFVPLDMESTMFLPPAAVQPRVVPTALRSERPFPIRGVVHDGNAFRLGGVTGHAGLFSTLRDMTIFAQTLLAGGSRGPIRVLSDATVRTFTVRQPGAGERALGWDTPAARSSAGRYLSARSFGHTGYTGTSIWIDPDHDLFVVLLTNRTYTEAPTGAMLDVRIAVHEAAARAIADRPITPRPGSR